MNEPVEAIEAYFTRSATQEQLHAIEAWIHSDPANAKAFMAEAHFRELVGQRVREQRSETGAVLAELAQLEAAAEAQTVTLLGELPEHDDPGSLSGNDLVIVGRYVLHRALSNKRAVHAAIGIAAAVLLLATVLLLNWGKPGGSEPIASNDTSASSPAEQANRTPLIPVATLTAAQDTRWEADYDFGTPEQGDELYVGQRLILREGYAEITTGGAATLLLEAPCTVEMIDSPNAIRLISGKLVGYVGSESAKGLLVRTPHMDITDLGTRFGVSCRDDGTALRVFEGEVYADAVKASSADEQMVVATGQSVIVKADASHVERVAQATDRFVTTLQAVVDAPALTGDIRYEPMMPTDLSIGAYENNSIRLFHERSGVTLDDALTVNVVGTGSFTDEAFRQTTQIAPAAVDSYLVHLDTTADTGAGRMYNATIRFNRPILAVLSSLETIDPTHATLGMADVRYATMTAENLARFTGLDEAPENLSISEDRMTLTLQISTGIGVDQFRVLVESNLLN